MTDATLREASNGNEERLYMGVCAERVKMETGVRDLDAVLGALDALL